MSEIESLKSENARLQKELAARDIQQTMYCTIEVCSATGEVLWDGRWWCKRHAPAEAAKYADVPALRDALTKAERARDEAEAALITAGMKIAALEDERRNVFMSLRDQFMQEWIDNDSVPINAATAEGWYRQYQACLMGWRDTMVKRIRQLDDGGEA